MTEAYKIGVTDKRNSFYLDGWNWNCTVGTQV
jgi:hypothetical protein